MWACPQCNSTRLKVQVVLDAYLRQDDDNFETDIEGSDHEWDGSSVMTCIECGHMAEAVRFETGGKPAFLLPGTRICSIQGETSDTDAAEGVQTGPNAVGVISQVLEDQEHCYAVDFPESGVSVFLSREDLEGLFYVVIRGEYSDETRPYVVSVNRTGYASREIPVQARFAEEAEWLAMYRAGDFEFPEVGSDYEVDQVRAINLVEPEGIVS